MAKDGRVKRKERSKTPAEEIKELEKQLDWYSKYKEQIKQQLEHWNQEAANADFAYSQIRGRLDELLKQRQTKRR